MDPVIQLKEGENVTLNCHVLAGNPPPEIRWIQAGRVISSDDHITTFGGTIMIDNIQVKSLLHSMAAKILIICYDNFCLKPM